VFLTNSLEEPEDIASNLKMIKWLTDEAKEANGIKNNTPVMSGSMAGYLREKWLLTA
jgi:hypothetical protein